MLPFFASVLNNFCAPAIRLAGLALAVMTTFSAAHASDWESLQREMWLRQLQEGQFKGTQPTRNATGLPARNAGSSEYLVRVVLVLPTDRQPAIPAEYAAKVATATARIRLAVEAINDFYIFEQERDGIASPASGMNLEREPSGEIRVLVVNGTKATEGTTGYWGDTTGLNGNNVYFNVLSDIFGSFNAANAACEKTGYIIFPDTLRIENPGTGEIYRGYLGLGASAGTAGYGGFGFMAYGALETLDVPASNSFADRKAALQTTLCTTETSMTLGTYTGYLSATPPACAAARNLMRAEAASIYLGVLAHETLHGMRVGHDGYTPGGLMGSGYTRMGETLREVYAMATCPAVPLTNPPNCTKTLLGTHFGRFVASCPYFTPITNPDKTDPMLDVAWPRDGHFYAVQTGGEAAPYPVRVSADAGTGTALNIALFYDKGNTFDDVLFGGSNVAAGDFNDFFFDKFVGHRVFTTTINDFAGNVGEMNAPAFGMIYTAADMGTSWNNVRWVRRPAGEDTRSRNAGSPLGTFSNPYSDIQTAIDAARTQGFGTIMIGEGVWPLSTPLVGGRRSVHITGEGVGKTILDGGGTLSAIFSDTTLGSNQEENVTSNLVLRNAQRGFYKTNTASSYNFVLSNCIIYNMTGTALDIPTLQGNVTITGNTIANCGAGIRLVNYTPFGPTNRFVFRNNLVANCAGEGIRLNAITGLYANSYVGYNLSTGNGTNFIGTGDGTTSYASNRLPGETSGAVEFIAYPATTPEDLKLRSNSVAYRSGHPMNQNSDSTRRDIGAWIDTSPSAAVADWSTLAME
jgi:hypothetical protein